MSDALEISWAVYIKAIETLCDQVIAKTPAQVIVGLTRGGLIPAVRLSHRSGKTMFAFDPHVLHSDGTARQEIHLPIDPSVTRRIIIVDDISDSGKTLDKVEKFFTSRGFSVETASVYINRKTTIHVPHYYVVDSKKRWIEFPYEEKE